MQKYFYTTMRLLAGNSLTRHCYMWAFTKLLTLLKSQTSPDIYSSYLFSSTVCSCGSFTGIRSAKERNERTLFHIIVIKKILKIREKVF